MAAGTREWVYWVRQCSLSACVSRGGSILRLRRLVTYLKSVWSVCPNHFHTSIQMLVQSVLFVSSLWNSDSVLLFDFEDVYGAFGDVCNLCVVSFVSLRIFWNNRAAYLSHSC